MSENLDPRTLIGRNINGFVLLKELGRGNNGVVFLARQELLEREVAFKVLLPECGSSPEYLVNFFREAKLVAKLDHPNIVQALETGNSPDGVHYFVMELVQGRSVEEIRVQNPELFSLDFVLKIAEELSDALSCAWRTMELIHGDIKPGNLLIRDSDQELKIVDLGVARVGATQLDDGEIMATPMYAAPEIIAGNQEISFKADIYSFGIMLYELLSGRAPFGGSMEKVLEAHLNCTPPALIEVNPDLDRQLGCFVDKMIAKAPEDRPASWSEIHEFFVAARQRLTRTAPPASDTVQSSSAIEQFWAENRARKNRAARWDKWGKIAIAVLVGLAAAALVGVVALC